MSSSHFFNTTDGYIYGWRWSNGDIAWWSTRELAEANPMGLLGPGELIRRKYTLGEIEIVQDVPSESTK